tara:strand:+ start:570 stop:1409 length:840 start_codon:yes stop_codon:yes gene_type:complete
MKLAYSIDGRNVEVEAPDNTKFFKGDKICLSEEFSDVTSNMDWYKDGYKVIDFQEKINFDFIKSAVTKHIKEIIKKTYPFIDLNGFTLEKYHYFVNYEQNLEINKKAKRLYLQDTDFPDSEIVSFLESILKVRLSYSPKGSNFIHWVIARINIPNSIGYNPVHKDIYGFYDDDKYVPRMVNTWIPICGVNKNAGLGIVPGSHLIKESEINRTKNGVIIDGRNFSVNCIKSWRDKSDLRLIFPKEGEMLMFSSHLIHGLGINNNEDNTRVSLEFRLYQND